VQVDEVGALLTSYCDEDDTTFLTSGNVQTYLEIAYRRFRAVVQRHDPYFYATRVNISVANADSYDLGTGAVILLGSGVLTGARLVHLVGVERVDASGNWAYDYKPAADFDELRLLDNGYLLRGSVLHFSLRQTATVRLVYVPAPAVDWSKLSSSDTEFIDDLEPYHDLIALYAYAHYAIRDGAGNPQVDALLARREAELIRYLGHGRSPGAADHIAWRS